MRTQIKPLFFTLFLIITACNAPRNKDLMLGEWTNESLKVFINHGKSDEQIFDVPAGEWEEKLQILPILTTYLEDGSYTSNYKDLEGKEVNSSSGKWSVIGDSLLLTENEATTAYHFAWMDGKAEFKGYLDWDGDGENDDLYTGIQIKQ